MLLASEGRSRPLPTISVVDDDLIVGAIVPTPLWSSPSPWDSFKTRTRSTGVGVGGAHQEFFYRTPRSSAYILRAPEIQDRFFLGRGPSY